MPAQQTLPTEPPHQPQLKEDILNEIPRNCENSLLQDLVLKHCYPWAEDLVYLVAYLPTCLKPWVPTQCFLTLRGGAPRNLSTKKVDQLSKVILET